jgi:hypothetical protein
LVVHICNSSTLEVDAGGWEVQGQPDYIEHSRPVHGLQRTRAQDHVSVRAQAVPRSMWNADTEFCPFYMFALSMLFVCMSISLTVKFPREESWVIHWY